jgi:AbrB family looped-hinge helix DNA binding protein
LDISENSEFSKKSKYVDCHFSRVNNMTRNVGCCKVDAVVTVDSKGQIVLPKDLREKAKLKPNDKLAVIGCERDGEICCFMLVKSEDLGSTIKNMLGPMLKDIFQTGSG